MFCYFEPKELGYVWEHPFPNKEEFDKRASMALLTPIQRKLRAKQLWSIGVRKAKVMASIASTFIAVEKDIKIFGQTMNLGQEKERDDGNKGLKCCCIIHPLGMFSKVWAIIITVMLMIQGLSIPFAVAFDQDFTIPNALMDAIFVLDIFFGFFSAYIRKDGMVE